MTFPETVAIAGSVLLNTTGLPEAPPVTPVMVYVAPF
jgi:hypothetical protein